MQPTRYWFGSAFAVFWHVPILEYTHLYCGIRYIICNVHVNGVIRFKITNDNDVLFSHFQQYVRETTLHFMISLDTKKRTLYRTFGPSSITWFIWSFPMRAVSINKVVWLDRKEISYFTYEHVLVTLNSFPHFHINFFLNYKNFVKWFIYAWYVDGRF